MKFIDWFAGIGGFRRGMELAGHECVGFCEFDKFATASYISMHLLTNEQRRALQELPLKKRQKEILKDEYRNGEWYANDVRRVCADDIPKTGRFWIVLKKNISSSQEIKMVCCLYMKHSQENWKSIGICPIMVV